MRSMGILATPMDRVLDPGIGRPGMVAEVAAFADGEDVRNSCGTLE